MLLSCADWVLCLLRSSSLQRHHCPSWLDLSEALSSLCSLCHRDTKVAADSIFSSTEAIISNTVALFRPYFNWGRILSPDSVKENTAHHRKVTTVTEGLKAVTLLECEENIQDESLRHKLEKQRETRGEFVGERREKAMPTEQAGTPPSPPPSHQCGGSGEGGGIVASITDHLSSGLERLSGRFTGHNGVQCSEEDMLTVARVMGRNVSVEEFVRSVKQLPREEGRRLLGVMFHVASC